MNKFAKTVAAIILLALAATSLFASQANDQAVIRIVAFVPEKSTFSTSGDSFVVESNAYNFSYAVQESTRTKMLFVMAN